MGPSSSGWWPLEPGWQSRRGKTEIRIEGGGVVEVNLDERFQVAGTEQDDDGAGAPGDS
jgi:hypothetical protein